MKPLFNLTLAVCIILCSFHSIYAGFLPSQEDSDIKIFDSFIERITNDDYDSAFLLLHPKLQNVWTVKRFSYDLKELKPYIIKKQSPIITGFFIGESQAGEYKQITYQFELYSNSITSLDLISINDRGEEYISRLHLRIPYKKGPPESAIITTNNFISSMKSRKYNLIQGLMSENCKRRFTQNILRKIRSIVVNQEAQLDKELYRICANSKWYDVAKIHPKGSNFRFVEIFMQNKDGISIIASLSFRGRA